MKVSHPPVCVYLCVCVIISFVGNIGIFQIPASLLIDNTHRNNFWVCGSQHECITIAPVHWAKLPRPERLILSNICFSGFLLGSLKKGIEMGWRERRTPLFKQKKTLELLLSYQSYNRNVLTMQKGVLSSWDKESQSHSSYLYLQPFPHQSINCPV